ncbi:thiolase-like protein, partial [Stachybotrys elegans]
TGTPVGDPLEVTVVGKVFRVHCSADEPLIVGSNKSKIGHLGGASGLAGIIKAVLMLVSVFIPARATFRMLDPNIKADFYNIRFPTDFASWPAEGVRRISVNSFGFGGANTHVVLDDALHYLQHWGLSGCHSKTITNTGPNDAKESVNGEHLGGFNVNEVGNCVMQQVDYSTPVPGVSLSPKLLISSALDHDDSKEHPSL